MIYSILDTDLYKFSTSYAYMKLYPEAEGTFSFIDRNNTILDSNFVTQVDMKLAELCNITFFYFLNLYERNVKFF